MARLDKNQESALSSARVKDVLIHSDNSLLRVYAGGDYIETTAIHPFYVVGIGWIPAIALKQGDMLVAVTGTPLTVQAVEALPIKETVYNLELDSLHTYYVGSLGVWVHNATSANNSSSTSFSSVIKGQGEVMEMQMEMGTTGSSSQ